METPEANIARGVQFLNGVYAQAFNARHDRVGHLFGGRYYAALLESEEHFSAAWLYIAQNPVRAGLCRRPEDWPWSGVAPGKPLSARDTTGV